MSSFSRWKVSEIVTTAVLGVALGGVFWIWSAGWSVVSVTIALFPPLGGLYGGGWLIAGVLGGCTIRRPGAALFCELLAAMVEGALGTHFGVTVILSGLLQGLGAELGFAVFAYRRFTLPPAIVSGVFSGLFLALNDTMTSNVAWDTVWKVWYFVFAACSGALIAGVISWRALRSLASTGVLANLASRQAATEPVL